jgi:hypothetical protein
LSEGEQRVYLSVSSRTGVSLSEWKICLSERRFTGRSTIELISYESRRADFLRMDMACLVSMIEGFKN